MTLPRRILPGSTYMITRRALRRTALFRPDDEVRRIFLYCLAVTSQKHRIDVHAAVLMSTHEHLILTDPEGQLPRFLQELHRLIALSVKVLRKWEGAVWDHEPTSVVELRTQAALVEKLAYVMANPVAAGAVRSARRWPGVKTLPCDLGCARWTASRPTQYFTQDDDYWPPEATLELVMPDFDGFTAEPLRDAVEVELKAAERAARKEVVEKGWGFLGVKRVLSASPYRRARSWEPLRSRNPSFAVGRGQKQAFFAAVEALRSFREAYRSALERWRKGTRDVLFPAGTWAMSWLHAVPIE